MCIEPSAPSAVQGALCSGKSDPNTDTWATYDTSNTTLQFTPGLFVQYLYILQDASVLHSTGRNLQPDPQGVTVGHTHSCQ